MRQHTSSEVTVTTPVNGHFRRCMLKHTKRQVRYIKVSYTMRLLFLMLVTAVCVLFLLNLIFSFGYLRRTLVVLEVLGAGFFVSSEAVSYLALNFQEN